MNLSNGAKRKGNGDANNMQTDAADAETHKYAQPAINLDLLNRRPDAVFWVSILLIIVLVLWAVLAPGNLDAAMVAATNWTSKNIGWTYLVVTTACIILMIYLGSSRFGNIKLGRNDDEPAFTRWAWVAMILGAVMGIGLISYGAAEPMTHFMQPPHGRADPETMAAAVTAMQFSYFDWGPNAWALFGVFGLAIAYSTHRRRNSGLVSPMLRPVLGRTMDGGAGKLIDIFVVLATLFGTTTSLGLGAAQIAEGANKLLGLPVTVSAQIIIIGGITVIFTASAMSGIGRGIKWTSQATMFGAAVLAAFVFLTGPTNFITNLYTRSLGQFIGQFPMIALLTPSDAKDLQWMQWWTYFMMAWWLSWSAFVGIFIAAISKGRTIREFVWVVLGVPFFVFSMWFTIFGGTAIHLEMFGHTGIGAATLNDTNVTFFALLSELPWPIITSILALIMIVAYFVTGADSNTFVLSSLSSRGSLLPRRIVLGIWGVLTGVVAMVLLVLGGLQALQRAAILSAVPFTVIVVLLGVSLMKELCQDAQFIDTRPVTVEELERAITHVDRRGG